MNSTIVHYSTNANNSDALKIQITSHSAGLFSLFEKMSSSTIVRAVAVALLVSTRESGALFTAPSNFRIPL